MGHSTSKQQREKLQRFASQDDLQITSSSNGYKNRYKEKNKLQIKIGKYGETTWDDQVMDTLRKDLLDTPELFVLNNMLMVVMFFEDYNGMMEDAADRRMEKPKDCILPDHILEEANKNVRFRPFHGERKHFSEPIAPKRMFTLNKSIKIYGTIEEIFNDDDESDNELAFRIEESRRKGFIRLKQVSPSTPDPDTTIPLKTASRNSPEIENVDYATFANIKAPKPIEIYRGLEKEENVPKSCIVYRKEKNLDLADDIDIEEITEDDLYQIVAYIGSKQFNKHFQTSLFPDKIAESLKFTQDDLALSKVIPGKILINVQKGEIVTPYEIIPCIPMKWPGEQTLEFLMKSQKLSNAKKVVFPTSLMVSEMKRLGCVVVPRGFIKKTETGYEHSELEWEIMFPQAEQYLESFFQHSQIKCFFYLLAIHKTFIEPKTFQLGLLPEHIRTFMFWECENNYSEWPEHRLGTKMMKVLKNLNKFISKTNLPDYFIKEKNHLEGINKKYLRHAQKIFHEVQESPLMHFITALRNLRYTQGTKFYPAMNFDELLEIVMAKRDVKPTIAINKPVVRKNTLRTDDNEIKWRQIDDMRKKQMKIKKLLEEEERQKEMDLVKEGRKGSVDSIELDWMCEKSFDLHKKRSILKFFIEIFIEISQKCVVIASEKFARFYLKQARYLTKLLEEQCTAFENEVEEITRLIANEERKIWKNKTRNKVKRSATLKDDSMMKFENFDSPTSRAPRKTVNFKQI